MPNTRSKKAAASRKRKNASQSRGPSLATVATVNNGDRQNSNTVRGRKRQHNNASQGRRGSQNPPRHEQNMEAANSADENESEIDQSLNANGGTAVTMERFREGQAMIEMTVQDNESFGVSEASVQSDEDDEDLDYEIEFTQQSRSSDAANSQSRRASAERSTSRQAGDRSTPRSNAVKIQETDREMKQKMQELLTLMTGEGLDESAEMMQCCIDASESENNDSRVKVMSRQGKAVNFNHNAMVWRVTNVESEETIYDRAVKQHSSSSKNDEIDTSDELLDLNIDLNHVDVTGREVQDNGSSRPKERQRSISHRREVRDEYEDAQPSTSRQDRRDRYVPRIRSPQEHTDETVKEAERSKAHLFPPQGKDNEGTAEGYNSHPFEFTAKMDEDYMVMGGPYR